LEGRVIHIRKVTEPVGESKPDWQILSLIAERLGKRSYFSYANPADIFEEFRLATKGGKADYYGITYEKIEQNDGVFWPCPSEDHPGTPTMFKERFGHPDGKANLFAIDWQEPGEMTDETYPHILTTGRVVYHYLSGNQTRRVDFLMEQCPHPYAEMHPELASQYNLRNGERARFTTRRKSMDLEVKLTKAIRKDTIFVPYHWGDDESVNQLTNDCLDPISRMPEFKVCAVRIERI
jgi:assimilatory nitrate reductase catalytic subunit